MGPQTKEDIDQIRREIMSFFDIPKVEAHTVCCKACYCLRYIAYILKQKGESTKKNNHRETTVLCFMCASTLVFYYFIILRPCTKNILPKQVLTSQTMSPLELYSGVLHTHERYSSCYIHTFKGCYIFFFLLLKRCYTTRLGIYFPSSVYRVCLAQTGRLQAVK